MCLKISSLMLLVGLVAYSHEQATYKVSRTAVVFGKADGLTIAVLRQLFAKSFETLFVYDGEHHYDSDWLIPEYATRTIVCPMASTDFEYCHALAIYAAESKPLDLIIDLHSNSAAGINAILKVFETRKPRIYAVQSSYALYTPCKGPTEDSTLIEYLCPPMGDTVLPIESGMHESEYEAGRRALEIERELNRLRETTGLSYLALRTAPIMGPREPLEQAVNGGAQKTRLLTFLLLSGLSAHLNQPILVPNTYRNKKWSVLHIDDVVKMVSAVDLLGNLLEGQPFARSYNLASNDITLKKLILTLASALGLSEQPTVTFVEESELTAGTKNLFYPDFYPATVTKPLNLGFVQRELRFRPTALAVALGETVSFYREALVQFDPRAAPTHKDKPIHVAIDTLVNAGLFTREQIDAFLDRLRNSTFDPTQTVEAPDDDESEPQVKHDSHTEL